MKYFLVLAILLTGCATGPKVKPMTEQETKNYKIDCTKRDQQIAQLKQQLEAQKLNSNIEDMTDKERLINGHIRSKLWAIKLECTSVKR